MLYNIMSTNLDRQRVDRIERVLRRVENRVNEIINEILPRLNRTANLVASTRPTRRSVYTRLRNQPTYVHWRAVNTMREYVLGPLKPRESTLSIIELIRERLNTVILRIEQLRTILRGEPLPMATEWPGDIFAHRRAPGWRSLTVPMGTRRPPIYVIRHMIAQIYGNLGRVEHILQTVWDVDTTAWNPFPRLSVSDTMGVGGLPYIYQQSRGVPGAEGPVVYRHAPAVMHNYTRLENRSERFPTAQGRPVDPRADLLRNIKQLAMQINRSHHLPNDPPNRF